MLCHLHTLELTFSMRKASHQQLPGCTGTTAGYTGATGLLFCCMPASRVCRRPHHWPHHLQGGALQNPSQVDDLTSGRNPGPTVLTSLYSGPREHLIRCNQYHTGPREASASTPHTLQPLKSLNSRLYILKNKFATHFISSVISKSTYWVYLWQLSLQLSLWVKM